MRASEWLIVGLLAVAAAPAVLAMSETWSRLDYYSHGYLVPLVALWAASAQRHVLPRLPRRRDLRGLAVLGVAGGAYVVGLGASLVWLQGLAVVVAVAGTVLFLRGPAWLRALSFSIGFLLFMIPLPDEWVTPVIAQLQLVVSVVGVELLHAMGFAVLREGNVLVLPGGEQLFVAEACSGITSIITLLPLAVFLGKFTETNTSRRIILVLAVVPVAMTGNLIRVVGTVLASARWGAENVTHGKVHDSAGLAVYVVGCLALIGIGALMRNVKPLQPQIK